MGSFSFRGSARILPNAEEAFGETAEHFCTVTTEQIVARLQSDVARGGFILGAFLKGAH